MDIVCGILGRTALRIGGALDEDWGTPRIHAVLATLLVHHGRPVPLQVLMEWAWPEGAATPENPTATFHTYATRIRRWLQRSTPAATLHLGNGACRLELDRSLIDYHRFRTLIVRARERANERDPRQAREFAERALMLWRGTPLADLSSEPARAWRTRVVDHEWLPANALLVDALLQGREFEQALARLDDLPAEHADDLALAKLRLTALNGLARGKDADTFYLATRRRLLHDGDALAADQLRRHQEHVRSAGPSSMTATITPDVVPRQLRHDIAGFVGREALLATLDEVTTAPSGGVVIIDGMAGVGKTALAVHWAHRARDRYPGGDFFVNLNGFGTGPMVSAASVVDDFLIALNHPPDDTMTARTKELLLSRLLAGRRTLVILDNARNSDHVHDLITLLPTSLVIVTSRQQLTRLTTAGARRATVEPMSGAEAVDLLNARLGTRRPVSEQDRNRLARLCGGLPLVIGVLAEHLATRPAAHLSTLVGQLDARRLITDIGADGDGPATPEIFFAFSYQALAEPEQRLLRLLSTHPGNDFTAGLAAACGAGSPAQTRRGLSLLVGAHLLEQPQAFDRYQFHDLIREYARHRAELDEPAARRHDAERRQLGYYLAAAAHAHRVLFPGALTAPGIPAEDPAEPRFASQDEARAWYDRERTNLTAAIHLAASHGHHDHAWQLTDLAATVFDRRGHFEDSRAVRHLAVMSARAAGHRTAEASTLVGLGMVETILGDHVLAREHLEAALVIVEEAGDHRGLGATLHQLARLETARGDHVAAVRLYRRCLEVNQEIDDPEGLCWTHCRIGQTLRVLERYEQALQHLRDSLHYAQVIADESARATCLTEIGQVHRDLGDHDTAAMHCHQALALVENMPIPDPAIMARTCIALAEISNDRRDAETATRYVHRAIAMAQRTRDLAAQARALELHGDIQYAHGEPHQAGLSWRQALTLAERTGNASHIATLNRKIAVAAPPTVPQARPASVPVLPRPALEKRSN